MIFDKYLEKGIRIETNIPKNIEIKEHSDNTNNTRLLDYDNIKDEELKNTLLFKRLHSCTKFRSNIVFDTDKKKLYYLDDKRISNEYYYKIDNGILFIKDMDKKDDKGNKIKVNDTTDFKLLRYVFKSGDIIISLGFKELGLYRYNSLNKLKDFSYCEIISNYKDIIYEEIIHEDDNDIYYAFYLDLDVDIKKDRYLENNISKCNNILKTSLECIIKTLNDNFKYSIDKKDIFIADANGDNELEKQNTYKYSKHIHLPIYLKDIQDLKILYTYLNTIIFNKNKYCFKDDTIVYDNSVYIIDADKNKYKKWRMLNQTKPKTSRKLTSYKLEGYGYSENVKDYNCIRYGRIDHESNHIFIDNIHTKYKLLNIEKVKELLYHNAKIHLGIDENIKNIVYDCLDYKIKTSKTEELNYNNIIDIYRKNNDNVLSIVECSLKVIPNDVKLKQDFKTWIKIARILKHIGKSHYDNDNTFYDMFRYWTLNAYKEKDKIESDMKCNRLWKSIILNDDNNIGIPSLKVFATICDKEFNMKNLFVNTYIDFYDINVENYNYDIHTLKSDEYLKDFDVQKMLEYDLVLVSLNVGEGKTEYVLKHNLGDILIPFSNRILFGKDMFSKCKNAFGDENVSFYFTDKHDGEINVNNKAFIVSIQSLYKYEEYINNLIANKKKVVLFLDEFEALYDAVICDTTNKKIMDNFKVLIKLWKQARLIIPVDAFISKRSFELIEVLNKEASINPKKLFINANKRNLYPKTLTIKGVSNDKYEKELLEKLICINVKKNLSNGDKFVMFSEFAEICKKIKDSLLNSGITEDKILTIIKDEKDDNPKKIEEVMNDTNKLNEYLCWIYNSCILNGVSFTLKHFNIGYIILGNFGVPANDTLNASFRSRTTNEFYVYYLHSGCRGKRTLLRTFPLNDDIIKEIRTNKINADYNNVIRNDENMNTILEIPHEYSKLYQYHDNTEQYSRQISINEVKYYKKDKIGNNVYEDEYLVYSTSKTNYDAFINIYNYKNKDTYNNKERLVNLGKKFINFNNIFKYEIIIQIAKDNGNIIKYDMINNYDINDNEYDNAYQIKNITIDDHIKSNLEKHFTKHIQKDKDYDDYGIIKMKNIEDVLNEKVNENDKKRCNYLADIINNYYNDNIKDDIFKLCSVSSYYEDYIYKLASITKRKNFEKYIKTFNYKYITSLIEVFEEFYNMDINHIADLFELKFCNIDLYNQIELKKKINDIATESRKFYKKPIPTSSKKNKITKCKNSTIYCIKKFIGDINDILEPLNIEYILKPEIQEIRKKIKDDKGNVKRVRQTKYIIKNNNTKNIFLKEDDETKNIKLKIYDLVSNFNYDKQSKMKEDIMSKYERNDPKEIDFIPESDDETEDNTK